MAIISSFEKADQSLLNSTVETSSDKRTLQPRQNTGAGGNEESSPDIRCSHVAYPHGDKKM